MKVVEFKPREDEEIEKMRRDALRLLKTWTEMVESGRVNCVGIAGEQSNGVSAYGSSYGFATTQNIGALEVLKSGLTLDLLP